MERYRSRGLRTRRLGKLRFRSDELGYWRRPMSCLCFVMLRLGSSSSPLLARCASIALRVTGLFHYLLFSFQFHESIVISVESLHGSLIVWLTKIGFVMFCKNEEHELARVSFSRLFQAKVEFYFHDLQISLASAWIWIQKAFKCMKYPYWFELTRSRVLCCLI